jgi:hypothetical protein
VSFNNVVDGQYTDERHPALSMEASYHERVFVNDMKTNGTGIAK